MRIFFDWRFKSKKYKYMDSNHISVINKFDCKKYASFRSVDKGTFLLLREGATSPIRGNYMVKFYS